MFTPANTAATRKNGAISIKSHVSQVRRHQKIPSSSTGKTATDPLLSIANTNAARLSQYQK